MTEQLAIPILVIGLLVAFGCGYLVGSNATQRGNFPVNYNPTQAIVSEATKAAEEHVRECYSLLAEILQKEADTNRQAH